MTRSSAGFMIYLIEGRYPHKIHGRGVARRSLAGEECRAAKLKRRGEKTERRRREENTRGGLVASLREDIADDDDDDDELLEIGSPYSDRVSCNCKSRHDQRPSCRPRSPATCGLFPPLLVNVTLPRPEYADGTCSAIMALQLIIVHLICSSLII